MKRDFPILAAFGLAVGGLMAACSAESDNTDEPRMPEGGEIAFTPSRSDQPTTTLTIPNFKVTAFKRSPWGRGEKIMDNVNVIRTGLNRWEYSPAVEWPTEPVDFYAVSPMEVKLNDEWASFSVDWNHTEGGNGSFFNSSTTDLLVAVRIGADQSTGRIRLNFRHALARISLGLRTNPVEGQAVRVRRISFEGRSEGKLYLPNETTSRDTFDGSLIDNWQIWNSRTSSLTLFEAFDDYVTLTAAPVVFTSEGRYIIPSHLKPIHASGDVTGERFDVVYQIVDTTTGGILWPNESTDPVDLLDPHSREWGVGRFGLYGSVKDNTLYPGYNYRFTITIDKESHLHTRTSSSSPLAVEIDKLP